MTQIFQQHNVAVQTSRTPLNILTLVLCQTVMSPHGKSFLRATMVDGRLHHLHTPRHKNKHKVHPVIQQLCLPQTLRDDVTKAYHDNNGHIGFDKLYESIRSKYYWPRMYADLSGYVRSCVQCQQTKKPTHHRKAPLQSLPVKDVLQDFIWTA